MAIKLELGEGTLHWPLLLLPQAAMAPEVFKPRQWLSEAAIFAKPELGEGTLR
jgi:hypothetical protein